MSERDWLETLTGLLNEADAGEQMVLLAKSPDGKFLACYVSHGVVRQAALSLAGAGRGKTLADAIGDLIAREAGI